MRRLLCSFLLLGALAGCQTGADADGALKSAAVEKSEKVTAVTNETVASVPSPSAAAAEPAKVGAAPEKLAEEPEPELKQEPEQEVAAKSAKASADPIAEAAASIAKLRKTKGERTAVEAVLACYKKAQAASAPMASAQVCAAQDFALSRNIIASRKPNGNGDW
ncbi:MAG: hypothetical protein U5K75_03495 [Ahrensia sp.]|nr:hypothetical protein [Ahrensia sp.]